MRLFAIPACSPPQSFKTILGDTSFNAALEQSKANSGLAAIMKAFTQSLTQSVLIGATPLPQAMQDTIAAQRIGGTQPIVPELPLPSRPPTSRETLQRAEQLRTEFPLSTILAIPRAGQAATSLTTQERRTQAQEKRDLRQAKLALLKEL